jgi:hypothetical protein
MGDGTIKKGAFSSPCLVEVPPSTLKETQELEARRMAHLRASRFCNKTLPVFLEAYMRVSTKTNYSSNKAVTSLD